MWVWLDRITGSFFTLSFSLSHQSDIEPILYRILCTIVSEQSSFCLRLFRYTKNKLNLRHNNDLWSVCGCFCESISRHLTWVYPINKKFRLRFLAIILFFMPNRFPFVGGYIKRGHRSNVYQKRICSKIRTFLNQ